MVRAIGIHADIGGLFLINRGFASLANDEVFWRERVISEFGTTATNVSWKRTYRVFHGWKGIVKEMRRIPIDRWIRDLTHRGRRLESRTECLVSLRRMESLRKRCSGNPYCITADESPSEYVECACDANMPARLFKSDHQDFLALLVGLYAQLFEVLIEHRWTNYHAIDRILDEIYDGFVALLDAGFDPDRRCHKGRETSSARLLVSESRYLNDTQKRIFLARIDDAIRGA